jgi:hypothetical protein
MKLAGVLVSDVSPMLVGYNHWFMVASRWFALPALAPLHPLTYTAKGTYHKI